MTAHSVWAQLQYLDSEAEKAFVQLDTYDSSPLSDILTLQTVAGSCVYPISGNGPPVPYVTERGGYCGELWRYVIPPLRELVGGTFGGQLAPSYFALMMDVHAILERTAAGQGFQFAACDADPASAVSTINQYLASFNTTSLVFARGGSRDVRPLIVEWSLTSPCDARDVPPLETGWDYLSFRGEPGPAMRWENESRVSEDFQRSIAQLRREMDESQGTSRAIVDRYSDTIQGYRLHISHARRALPSSLGAVFVPSRAAGTPKAALFLLFDTTGWDTAAWQRACTSAVTLARHVAGVVDRWQALKNERASARALAQAERARAQAEVVRWLYHESFNFFGDIQDCTSRLRDFVADGVALAHGPGSGTAEAGRVLATAERVSVACDAVEAINELYLSAAIVARSEAAKAVAPARSVSPEELDRRLRALLAFYATYRVENPSFSCDVAANLPSLSECEQAAVVELVRNAVKHRTQSQSLTVKISASRDANCVRLCVTSGPHSAENLDRVDGRSPSSVGSEGLALLRKWADRFRWTLTTTRLPESMLAVDVLIPLDE